MDYNAFIKQIDDFYAAGRFDELGTYYRGATRFEEAIRFFQLAIDELAKTSGKKSLEYATAVNNLGGAFRMSGQYDSARRCFTEMTAIYAEYKDKSPMLYASGINNLALLDLACKDYEKSIPALEKALQIMSRFPQYQWEQATTLCNLGICMLRTGKLEKAEQNLLRARSMIASMPESRQGHLGAIWSALGELYLEQNDEKKALKAFEAARATILKHYGKNKDYENMERMIGKLTADQPPLQPVE